MYRCSLLQAEESQFLTHRVATASRRNAMAQYWFDRILAVRDRELQRRRRESEQGEL